MGHFYGYLVNIRILRLIILDIMDFNELCRFIGKNDSINYTKY